MKNLFKFGFLGLALTFAVAACNNQPTETEADDVDVMVEDTSAVTLDDVDTTVIDTNATDTNIVN